MLIRIKNLIINAALLVEAEYKPAGKSIYEDTGAEYTYSAKLTLRFSAPQSKPHTNYNGDYTGNDDHSPYCRVLQGEDAEFAWNQLCEECEE